MLAELGKATKTGILPKLRARSCIWQCIKASPVIYCRDLYQAGQGNSSQRNKAALVLHFNAELDIFRHRAKEKDPVRKMSNSAIDITLLGRTYSIACPPGQEQALQAVAQKLELQLGKIKSRTNAISREEMALMAALNIGYELYEEQRKNQDYMSQMDDRIRLLQSTLEHALVERSARED